MSLEAAVPSETEASRSPDARLEGRMASFGPFRLIPSRQLLLKGDTPVTLGGRALDVLTTLVERAGTVVDKRVLIERTWGRVQVEESSLRAAIVAVRRALGASGDAPDRYVSTIAGRGYQFTAPVSFFANTGSRDAFASSLSRIVGREKEIAMVADDLRRHRCITLVGPGGVGKTTIALAATRHALTETRVIAGACLVDLCTQKTADAAAIRQALGIAVGSADPLSDVAAFVHGRPFVFVLEGCERHTAHVALLAEALITRLPGVAVIACSREPLRASGERVRRIEPLPLPPDGFGSMSAVESLGVASVRLFVELATASSSSFGYSDGMVAAVTRICQRLDGIPLAIEIAASLLDVFDLQVMLNLLEGPFVLNMVGRNTAAPRHRSLEATLNWSYETLTGPERVAFRRLALFPGLFSYDAARYVAGGDGLAMDDIGSLLACLTAKSLLVAKTGCSQGTHGFLQTTRAYALQKLAESGERNRVAVKYRRRPC